MYTIDNLYDSRLKRRRRIDPTRELNYTPSHWERHKSVYRRIKHVLTTFGASPFQRLLFPDFFITSVIAGSLTYYNELVAVNNAAQIYMDASYHGAFAASTTALAILTGFRLNASYGRYTDGRRQLGLVNAASRDLASNTLMWVESRKDRDRMLLLIKAYSVALNYYLNKKGSHNGLRRCDPNFEEQVYAEFQAEMKDIYHENDHDTDLILLCTWFRNNDIVPLGIISLMRKIISHNGQRDALNRELDLHVQKLISSLGACEGIQKTPIPTCFTRHTSRLLFVWSNMMPFAIYGACGPLLTLPATIGISYTLMGIEDIGVQLEEPFNILPLRQYSDGVYDAVDFIATAYSDNDNAHQKYKFNFM
ncbi:hypothetical protein ACHAWU_009413 [Discostella pseudostelligera]|uniref:Bestrophin homolog n=1 Tax=Discostella pseudostelligera TaxID=259834 RepID=A0ABD3MX54_9STRA